MLFPFVFLIPWGSYRVCITAATGLSLSIKSDRLWHCRLTLTSIHSPLTVLINEKAKRCLFYVYFSSPFRTYCWIIVFQRLCYKILTLFCLRESEKLNQHQTRSSWLNCALRDDEAVYWVSIGHYEAVAVGN